MVDLGTKCDEYLDEFSSNNNNNFLNLKLLFFTRIQMIYGPS